MSHLYSYIRVSLNTPPNHKYISCLHLRLSPLVAWVEQIELVCRVLPWKTEPTPAWWHPHYTHAHTHTASHSPVVIGPRVRSVPESSRGLFLISHCSLETAALYDCRVVWPGLSTSPRKACRWGKPGGESSLVTLPGQTVSPFLMEQLWVRGFSLSLLVPPNPIITSWL